MISRWARAWLPRAVAPAVHALARAGVTPNMLTAAGLAACILAGVLAALGRLWLAAVFVLLEGMFDSLDGELARCAGTATPLGPFIDSAADHYGDFAISLGIAWYALSQAPVDRATALLVFAALFGSVVGSHLRSRAGMLGIDTRWAGFFTRLERTLVIFLGLATGWLLPAMAVLALGTNVSALQRFVYVIRTGKNEPPGSE